MHDSYLFLTPILTLLVVALVGFVGCDHVFGLVHVDDPLQPVQNFTATPNDQRVELAWDQYSNATGYTIHYGTMQGQHPESFDVTDASATTATRQNLMNGIQYYFVINAHVGSKVSPDSSEQLAVPGVYGVPIYFITAKTLGTAQVLSGQMGLGFVMGTKSVDVVKLGRGAAPGNNMTHRVRLIEKATKAEIASVTVNTGTPDPNGFAYGDVSPSVTLTPGATYYLLSDEPGSGDTGYDAANTTVTVSQIATREFAAYGDFAGNFTESPVDGHAYGPVDFVYVEKP